MRSQAPGVTLPLVLVISFFCSTRCTAAQEPVALSQVVGTEIDSGERGEYRLFPGVNGFDHARILRTGGKRYRLEYDYRDGGNLHSRARKISPESFDQTRLHVALIEAYHEAEAAATPESTDEARLLQRLALRFASETRYDLATGIADYLRKGYPESEAGRWASEYGPRMEGMAKRPRALFAPGSLIDQRGRTDLLVFSGLYGLWLGLAIPAALDAQSGQEYAAGLIATPSLAVLIASAATHDADITEGQATIISLGGRLGTWQGLGWAALSDGDGQAVLGAGVLAGLAGIATAIPLGRAVDFTEGHATITSSAMYWGGWYGAVLGTLSDDAEMDHGVLRDMLIGSDVLVLATGLAARGAHLSKGRMRLINLSGVLGTAFGFGLDLLFEVDDTKTTMAIAGAGSAAGLTIGSALTRHHDDDKDLASGISVEFPRMAMRPVNGAGGAKVPTLGLSAKF